MKHKSTDQLLKEYRHKAVIHGDALERGQSRRCNRAMDLLTEIRRELHARGPEHMQRLLAYLDDENRAVRAAAAVDALAFAPEEGVRVLREVAGGPRGMVRFGAEMMLKRWEAGDWNTDP